MDLILECADAFLLDRVYPSTMARDDVVRQTLSLFVLTVVGVNFLYLSGAAFSYYCFFDHSLKQHPRFLPNQVTLEIQYACQSIPIMATLIVPWFLAEVRGYSKLYTNLSDHSLGYTVFSIVWFLLFTDMLIYWIHRVLHHRSIYALIHKPHHKWIVSTPFASHAFHPIDGFLQGLPYHLFLFLFPLHRGIFLVLYAVVNYWTISIHDGNYVVKNAWLNGAAHHTLHHLEFVVNYGQYFTLWDRLGGSYKEPAHAKPE